MHLVNTYLIFVFNISCLFFLLLNYINKTTHMWHILFGHHPSQTYRKKYSYKSEITKKAAARANWTPAVHLVLRYVFAYFLFISKNRCININYVGFIQI